MNLQKGLEAGCGNGSDVITTQAPSNVHNKDGVSRRKYSECFTRGEEEKGNLNQI